MRIDDVMRELLGGELEDEEMECLRKLSPQGLAKVNADLLKGVDPEKTMVALRKAFRANRHYRERVVQGLPAPLRKLLTPKNPLLRLLPAGTSANGRHSPASVLSPTMSSSSMRSTPTTPAMEHPTGNGLTTPQLEFLMDSYIQGSLGQYLSPKGDVVEDCDLQDCVEAHQANLLVFEAKRMMTRNGGKVMVIPTHFATVEGPSDDITCPYVLRPYYERLLIQTSPFLSWFSETQEAPLEVSTEAAQLLLFGPIPDDASSCGSDIGDAEDLPPNQATATASAPRSLLRKPCLRRKSGIASKTSSMKSPSQSLDVLSSDKAVRFVLVEEDISFPTSTSLSCCSSPGTSASSSTCSTPKRRSAEANDENGAQEQKPSVPPQKGLTRAFSNLFTSLTQGTFLSAFAK